MTHGPNTLRTLCGKNPSPGPSANKKCVVLLRVMVEPSGIEPLTS